MRTALFRHCRLAERLRDASRQRSALPPDRPAGDVRVMDFYHAGADPRRLGALDMLDLLMQMGVDVLDRMSPIFRRGG